MREGPSGRDSHGETARAIAAEIEARARALPRRDTPSLRAVRRVFSHRLAQSDGGFVLEVARQLLRIHGERFLVYELIHAHKRAFLSLDRRKLVKLGEGLDSWWAVDSFARSLSGPAWREGLVDDEVIRRWARSRDRWWRRAALVSTVAWNVRSQGGQGDVPRTLGICRLLVDDHDDMVEKALSWALRELVVHDPAAVERFMAAHAARLGSRVKREVESKLKTGLKNPRSRSRRGGSSRTA